MKRDGLTPQQWRVAELVEAERTDKQIAAELLIDQRTVAFHIQRIAVAWDLKGVNTRVSIALRMRERARKPAA